MLKDPNFVKSYIEAAKDEEEIKEPESKRLEVDMAQLSHTIDGFKHVNYDFSDLKMHCKNYYPMDIVFEMMIPKEMLKKNIGLKKIHKLV